MGRMKNPTATLNVANPAQVADKSAPLQLPAHVQLPVGKTLEQYINETEEIAAEARRLTALGGKRNIALASALYYKLDAMDDALGWPHAGSRLARYLGYRPTPAAPEPEAEPEIAGKWLGEPITEADLESAALELWNETFGDVANIRAFQDYAVWMNCEGESWISYLASGKQVNDAGKITATVLFKERFGSIVDDPENEEEVAAYQASYDEQKDEQIAQWVDAMKEKLDCRTQNGQSDWRAEKAWRGKRQAS